MNLADQKKAYEEISMLQNSTEHEKPRVRLNITAWCPRKDDRRGHTNVKAIIYF